MTRRQIKKPSGNSATFVALIALLLIAFGLAALVAAVIMPSLVAVALVGAGFFGFFALHYLIWGRWLLGNLDSQDQFRIDGTHDRPEPDQENQDPHAQGT